MLKQIEVNNHALNVLDVGAGSVLLLVHGFPLDHTMWQGQISHFSKTHRVIAPDLRGFGKSSEVESDPILMSDFAADLSELLHQLEVTEPVTLSGLSMGGYIALQFALNHSAQLKSLILCDTKSAADSEEAQKNRQATATRVLKEGTGFLADAMPEKLFAAETIRTQVYIVEQTQQVIRSTSAKAVAAASLGMAARPDTTPDLASIHVPTLLIVGEEDSITTPTEMRSMAEALPKSLFTVIPNAGHMSPLEAPTIFNQHVEKFL